jgi:hypothetical protein
MITCVLVSAVDFLSQKKYSRYLKVDLYNSVILCYHLRQQRVIFEPNEACSITMNYVNGIILWSVGEMPMLFRT